MSEGSGRVLMKLVVRRQLSSEETNLKTRNDSVHAEPKVMRYEFRNNPGVNLQTIKGKRHLAKGKYITGRKLHIRATVIEVIKDITVTSD
jgi:hypothetical protein